MNTKILFASTIALTLIGSAIVPQNAQAEIKTKFFADEGYYFLRVPDTDTTLPAYGGRLRLYDVHIAKMFEISYSFCQSAQYTNDRVLPWYYYADNGKTNMGEFRISCELARDIVSAYGLGKPERTETDSRPKMFPTLNITGGKVDKWIRFTNNFKPVR
jgi:hypothetical protein